jgi:hypothetical protein
MKKTMTHRDWTTPNAQELAAATVAFDDPDYGPPAVKLPAQLRARHQRALAAIRAEARKRPSKQRKIQVTVEDDLLKKTDQAANSRGLSRSQMISAGLRLLLID